MEYFAANLTKYIPKLYTEKPQNIAEKLRRSKDGDTMPMDQNMQHH